jgi:hypothetical protein
LPRAKTFECFRIRLNNNQSFQFLNRHPHLETAGFSAVSERVVLQTTGQLNTIALHHLLRWILIVIGRLEATTNPSS